MTPTDLTQRLLALAAEMDRLAVDLHGQAGYETTLLRHQLAQAASALRSKQPVVAAEVVT